MPLVSVIVPVYNASRYLDDCINNILNQSMKDIEIIFVNDGSTDNSLDILNEYAQKDTRIIVCSQENMSAGAARNKGLDMATGKYLSFLDVDDIYEPDMLSKAYCRAEEVSADVIVYRSDRFDERTMDYTEMLWTIRNDNFIDLDVFSHADIEDFYNCFASWAWDKLFRADFIKENGLYFQNQKCINDLCFVYCALAKAKRIGIVEELLIHKRHNNMGSITTHYSQSKHWDCFYKALYAIKEQLIEWELYEELKKDYVNYALKIVLYNLNKFKSITDFSELYTSLKVQWLSDLDILEKDKSFFYDESMYYKLVKIMDLDSKAYVEEEILKDGDGTFLFPFELVEKNAKIVLYGAGNVGKAYYRQVMFTKYCKIVAWVDKNATNKSSMVSDVEVLADLEADYIVIAINNKKTVDEIKKELEIYPLNAKQIIWREPEVKIT